MLRNAAASTGMRPSGGRVLEPIASTKLAPPRGARLMPREALTARLLEARRQRCVVLQGPAGCGKTSTLVAWRQALLPLDFDVAWLSLSAEDDEPTRFFDCLLASLAEVNPAVVRQAAFLMGRGSGARAVEHWVISLVQGVAERGRELVLVLDDLHLLGDACIFQALQWLLDYAPPNLHLAFGSRSALPLSLSRLRAQGLLAEFDLRDLRFSAEESERFLREQLGGIDRRDAQVLHELTDGWVAGLQLFAVDLKAKRGAGYARVEVRDARAFASYFEREVLGQLAPDDLELLTRMAICNRFCASLCATLLGEPQALARMTTRLVHLDRENLFISQVSDRDREAWYRLHPLLREVLLARLAALPEAELRGLHGRAWRWFDAHGHIDEAVRHAVRAGEVQAAADMVEACAYGLLAQGALTRLAGLMRRLPAEQVQARIGLRLITAYLQLYACDLDALRQGLQRMHAERNGLDLRQRHIVTMLYAGLAMQSDDTDAMQAILPQLQAIPHDADAFIFVGRSHLLAWMHMYLGEFTRAREVLRDGVRHGTSAGRRLVGRCLEGMSIALEGRMLEAERIYREAMQEAEGDGTPDIGVVCMAAGLLGDALYEFGEPEAVCTLLEDRIEMLERASIPDAVLRGMMALAAARWLLGCRTEAWARLERLEDYAVRHRLPRLLAYALATRLRWHLGKGEIDRAEAALQRITALAAQHAGAAGGTAGDILRCAERAQADMCLHWNDFDGAAARLGSLVARFEAQGRWRSVAGLRLRLAIALQGRGDHAAARSQVLDALALGHRLGLLRSLLDAAPQVPAMVEALLQEGELDPVLAFYAQRVTAAAARARARGALHAPAANGGAAVEAFSERELEVLSLVAQAMPNKKIARVLGVTPHTVKWHLRKIYGKLGVSHRDEAVARLRDLAGG